MEETAGSLYKTSPFSANAGAALDYYFNYITSDGSGFSDYAWAQLQTAAGTPVATLLTARTRETGSIVPGFGLPGVDAQLVPPSAPIIPGAPDWSLLGPYSGSCFDLGCGYTGWIHSIYNIEAAGTYVLAFGVTNWFDEAFDSGLAFSSISVGGTVVDSTDAVVPVPAALPLFASGLAAIGFCRRRRQRADA
jgi:hypothetical protein